MADAYSYRLLVELEENNIPRLKNKLVKYFQSKKSNGGDCEVEYESGSRTATLRFRTEEDQRNVLGKEVHQISLDKGVLKMTVRLPDQKAAQESPPDKLNKKSELTTNNTQSSADDPTAAADVQTEEEEELCSTLAVIGNIPESFNRELLELMVENLLKDVRSSTASQGFTLEVLPAISSAVVTFQSEKGNTDWCTPNRIFTRMGLSVRPLEVTKQVVVEDIAKYNEDFLQMYFEKEGGDVENVLLNEVEQSAIITFKDHKAVQKVLKKKKHHIKQKELRVYPFYESLGTALYALFIGDNASKPQKEGDFVIEAQKIDPACFHICGDSQTKVDSAKQWINDLFSKECVTNTFSDYTILSLSDADHQCIVDMEKTMGVCIRAESKKSKATITIEGFTKDVLKATTEIQDMLTKVRNEKELMKKVEVTGTLAEWQYQQQVNVASVYLYLNHGVM